MTAYRVDMGFDWDSLAKDTTYNGFLQIGLVKITGQTAVPASFAEIDTGDTVSFNLFDLSEAPNNDVKTPSIVSSGNWLLFSAADSLTTVSAPVTGGPTAGATFGTAGTGTSAIFSRSPQNTWPMWPVNSSNGSPLSLQIANTGNFFFTLGISVTNSQGVTKTFGVDPEMIVKS